MGEQTFPKGTVSDCVLISHWYQDAVLERLRESGATLARQHQVIAVLWVIIRNLRWQTYQCEATALQLCDIMGIDKAEMARALKLLEQVGAIRRLKGTRPKVITVTPEGVYYGDIPERETFVMRYRQLLGSA